MSSRKKLRRRGGFAYILAVLLVALFVSMGAALASFGSVNFHGGDNLRTSNDARMAAECGLHFMLRNMRKVSLPVDTDATTLIPELHAALAARLEGTGNLPADGLGLVDGVIIGPLVDYPDGQFRWTLRQLDETYSRLTVTGMAHGLTRRISVDFTFGPARPGAMYYGLASRGQIDIWGNPELTGVNSAIEASVLSTSPAAEAIRISGSVTIEGNLYTSGEDSYVVISGGGNEIGGETDVERIMNEHVHTGVEEPSFPEIDVEPIRERAVNVIATEADWHGVSYFENILIKANTNPRFTAGTVINGVVFVEAPNKVEFRGSATINAMIATEPNDYAPGQCTLTFNGNTTVGAEGTSIVAPGFQVSFSGNSNGLSGMIAADQITFAGNSSTSLSGSIIGLADKPTLIHGNVQMAFDTSNSDQEPIGFRYPQGLRIIPDSYTELED